ncbi:MAG: hypothetical protein RI988_3378 [Pseudomonadota bacterium]
MSGHPAPSREARKEAARAAAGGTYSCGGTGEYRSSSSSSPLLRTGADYGHGGEVLVVGGGRVGSCVDVAPTLNAGGNRTGGDRPYGTSVDTCDSLCVAVVGALACNTGPKGHDAGNFACNQAADEGRVVPVVISEGVDLYNGSITDQVAATFNASSGDANHSGPKVMHTASCIAFPAEMSATQSATTEELAPALSVKHTTAVASCLAFDTTQISSPHNYSNPKPGDPCHPLAAGAHPPAVVYGMTTEQTPKFAEDLALTLTKQSPTGGGQPQAVAYSITPMNSGKDYKARETDVAQPVMAAGPVGGNQGGDFVLSHAIQAGALRTNPSSGPNGVGVQADLAYTLEARSEVQAVAFQPRIGRNGRGYSETVFPALNGADAGATSDMRPCVANAATSAVRRLTPVECERLQGFPDGFTAIPWGKKSADECPDGPRYKVLGNSMAVPVMRWIGERIQLVDDFVSLF